VKSILKTLVRRAAAIGGFDDLRTRLDRIAADISSSAKAEQLLLRRQYEALGQANAPLMRFEDVELRVYSQNGEDGILLYLFSLIGMKSYRCVEIGAGDGSQCNTSNLIINHGWTGLLLEGDARLAAQGKRFFTDHPDTSVYPPMLVHVWITRENVNELLAMHGFEGEIDLLSLDIDGVDYWIWDAIDRVSPRVVVAEVQVIWGDDRAVTVPYRPDFVAQFVEGFGVYSGASLPAFVKLGRRKGYRLVGCQRYGFNAFFMREGVGEDMFPEVPVAACLQHPFVAWARDRFLPMVRDRQWVDV